MSNTLAALEQRNLAIAENQVKFSMRQSEVAPESENGVFDRLIQEEDGGIKDHKLLKTIGVLSATGAIGVAYFMGGARPTSEERRTGADLGKEKAEEVCPDSFPVVQLPNDGHRIAAGGMPSAAEAKTNEEARKALADIFVATSRDPEALAANVNDLTDSTYKAPELHDGKCFTPLGQQAAAEYEVALMNSEATPKDPTPDMTNQGAREDTGEIVAAEESGLTGDLAGITIKTKDGRTRGFLARCINMTKHGKFKGVPTDKTDNPDKPTPSPSPSSTPPTTTIEGKRKTGRQAGNPLSASSQSSGVPDKAGKGAAQQEVDPETGCLLAGEDSAACDAPGDSEGGSSDTGNVFDSDVHGDGESEDSPKSGNQTEASPEPAPINTGNPPNNGGAPVITGP